MIGVTTHHRMGALHRFHARRSRHAWMIMTSIVVIAYLLFISGYFSHVTWVPLTEAVMLTTYRVVVAYAIAVTFGVTIALLVGWSPLTDFFFPIFDVLQNLPSFALIPLFIYFLGYSGLMVILFAVSSVLWPILFATMTAIRSAHKDLNDAATIFGARGLRRIPFYLAPLSFPAILTGSIVGIAMGWESVIGAEIIANIGGFGAFIKDVDASGISSVMIAGTLAILVIVFVVNRLIWAPLLSETSRRYAE
ncbi:ABC transporter permease subunit [Candidatus Parcubacteria bacterium]|nr:ABC transporter permease subunit [Candidatus Parcubacteria bacterium]